MEGKYEWIGKDGDLVKAVYELQESLRREAEQRAWIAERLRPVFSMKILLLIPGVKSASTPGYGRVEILPKWWARLWPWKQRLKERLLENIPFGIWWEVK